MSRELDSEYGHRHDEYTKMCRLASFIYNWRNKHGRKPRSNSRDHRIPALARLKNHLLAQFWGELKLFFYEWSATRITGGDGFLCPVCNECPGKQRHCRLCCYCGERTLDLAPREAKFTVRPEVITRVNLRGEGGPRSMVIAVFQRPVRVSRVM